MPDSYFFDSSAIIKKRPDGPAIEALLGRLNRQQCYTSVLVAYELLRGIPALYERRKFQEQAIEALLHKFTRKAVTNAHALAGAKAYHYSAGDVDPILAAQAVDGNFVMVTVNLKHFRRVPGLKLFKF